MLECVHKHIQSLPVCTNHYSRATAPNRQYLESEGSIRDLYRRYVSWMIDFNPTVVLVKEKFYLKIIGKHYNIGFRPPKKDSCKTCELLKVQIQNIKKEQRDISVYKEMQKEHYSKVEKASKLMKSSNKLSDEWIAIAMDLQHTMPVPKLSVGQAYYKRKL